MRIFARRKITDPVSLPDRYFALEPNEWLWSEAFAQEIGKDIKAIKRPAFSSAADFALSIFNQEFDYIVAQSIFSHTGLDHFERAVEQASLALAVTGQFLFTALSEDTAGFGQLRQGEEELEWVYLDA